MGAKQLLGWAQLRDSKAVTHKCAIFSRELPKLLACHHGRPAGTWMARPSSIPHNPFMRAAVHSVHAKLKARISDGCNLQLTVRHPNKFSPPRSIQSHPRSLRIAVLTTEQDHWRPKLSEGQKCRSNKESSCFYKMNTAIGSFSTTPDIEKKYVHGVYDAIAPHFSSTRYAKWPKVSSFLDSLVPGSLIIDAGCGNGKYLGLNPRCYFMGCDISSRLVSICSQKGHEVLVGDALHLPYRRGLFDSAISIAVLHHLSTEERRRKAIHELARVMRKGGKAIITVWAVEQEDRTLLSKWTPLTLKYSEEWVDGSLVPNVMSSRSAVSLESIEEHELLTGTLDEGNSHSACSKEHDCLEGNANSLCMKQQDFFVPWHLPYHRAEIGGAAAAVSSGLARKDDKKAAVVYNRYYHVFVEGELERLVSHVEAFRILDSFYDKSNWCVIIERT